MTDSDDVTIAVDGAALGGWQAVEITLRAEGFPNSFTITASVRDTSSPMPAIAGAACTVLIGSDTVITGFIDRDIAGGAASAHTITLLGRGRTQDLVDCSAEWPSGQMIEGDALTIAQRIAGPYGLSVILGEGAAAGPRVPAWLLNYGESGAEIIQRIARNAGLLAYENGEGELVLGTAGARVAASGAIYGGNVEAWSVENATDGRFSDYVCCGMSMDALGDLGGDTFYHRETDPNVRRHRLMYLVVETVAEEAYAFTELKARWELARRAGRSAVVRVTVDSWRDDAGRLWEPNSLIPVAVPGHRGASQLVIAEVTFRRTSETGTTADLVLMPREAFTPEPIVLQPVNVSDLDQLEPAS